MYLIKTNNSAAYKRFIDKKNKRQKCNTNIIYFDTNSQILKYHKVQKQLCNNDENLYT